MFWCVAGIEVEARGAESTTRDVLILNAVVGVLIALVVTVMVLKGGKSLIQSRHRQRRSNRRMEAPGVAVPVPVRACTCVVA